LKENLMRSRLIIYALIAAVAVVALVAGIVAVAGAGQSTSLPAISAPDLLAKMAQNGDQARAVSGDVSWKNDLFGNLAEMGSGTFGGASAQLPLVSSGSGRLWLAEDGARVESQAGGGDQVIAVDAKTRTAWVYDYSKNTARRFVVTGQAPGGEATPSPLPSEAVPTPAVISGYLEQVAQFAKVEVAGQTTTAGRAVYVLRMTPTAQDTALGSVQASIDGKTFVPLDLEVFAKGGTSPVLRFGFTTVSYDPIPASTFAFTPPAGAAVTTKTIDLSKMAADRASAGTQARAGKAAEPTAAQMAAHEKIARRALLTLDEAQKLVPFKLASAQDYTARPFDWAAVIDKSGPLTALGRPVASLMGAAGMGDAAQAEATSPGPTAVLLYGQGFGTIVLAETQTTPALEKQLKQLPALVDTTSVNGVAVRSLTTPLGGAYVWQLGDTTLVAGGMVPKADLQAFVDSVR
jgi:outer membrane lipoprotein-sorting protein